MTYDPVTQRTLLFGGFGPSVGYLSETWVWSGRFWTQIGRFGPSARGAHSLNYDLGRQRTVLFGGGPPARAMHAMAFDNTSSKVVLFGGFPAEGAHDTGEWDATTWTKVADTGPGLRLSPVLASAGRALFLHGGAGLNQTFYGDTWQWAGGEWKKVQEMGPSPRQFHAMTFDTNQSRLVLFGGAVGNRYFDDTWEATVAEPGPST